MIWEWDKPHNKFWHSGGYDHDIIDHVNQRSCDCVEFERLKLYYSSELVSNGRPMLILFIILCVALFFLNFCYLVIQWKSSKVQEKCPSYEDATKHLGPKVDNDPVHSAQHSDLSAVVVKC